MPERPLLLLPKPGSPLEREKNKGFPSEHLKLPSVEEQSYRFTGKFKSMIDSFVTESPDDSSIEKMLVIETVGNIENFKNAVNKIEGLEWQLEADTEDIRADDSFYQIPKIGKRFFSKRIDEINSKDSSKIFDFFDENNLIDSKGYLIDDLSKDRLIDKLPDEFKGHTEKIVHAVNDEKKKQLSGRLYLSMSNRQALEKMKSLFDANQKGESPPELIGVWKDLFSHLRDVRFWSVEDRFRDTGIIEHWKQEFELKKGTSSMMSFEIELVFAKDPSKRKERQQIIENLVSKEKGNIIAVCEIEEIRFHALKIELPVNCIERVLNDDYGAVFTNGGIAFFRPNPQSSTILLPEGEIGDLGHFPSPSLEPVIALFDGYPFAQHRSLKDYLDIDDPDSFLDAYEPNEFRHGTAMASLICHGELDVDNTPSIRRLYVRPILQPDNSRDRIEQVPGSVFFEDLVERAVKRMFEGEGDIPPTAPNVKIINLSVGDPNRVFLRYLSPMARLLDWLSFKYRIIFCVSAGNILGSIDLDLNQEKFENLDNGEKITSTLKAINSSKRNRRILSPGESINALTVGSLHEDSSKNNSTSGVDLLPSNLLPSPISALGFGYRSSIKPDILFPGGRQFYQYNDIDDFYIFNNHFPPGHKVAGAPINPGETTRTLYTRGTSNSTALASRSLGMIYDVLEQQFIDWNMDFPHQNIAPLLKSLLIHGASWQGLADELTSHLNLGGYNKRNEIARFLGYGRANVQKSLECTYHRATGIGYGSIDKDDRHEFKFPIPESLAGMNCWRRLTLTLAWLSPVSPESKNYRKAALSFDPAGFDIKIGGTRNEAEWHQVKNGTVQHEILEGNKVGEFIQNDHLTVAVQCREDATPLDVGTPYGLAVSLEVKEDVDIAVYDEIKTAVDLLIKEQVAERV
ncbi:MAG: S8 family peptidase [Deltaproteobacteria bacterium]|nr:S8 family peptidase [Deltaproteobacteria bacterium]